MENFIIDNFKYVFDKFGIGGLFLILIITIFLYLIFEIVRVNYENIIKLFKFSNTKLEISDSIIFHKIDVMVNFRVDRLRISCPLRYKIFTDIIKIKLKKRIEHLKDIKNEEILNLNNVELKDYWENKILNMDKETTSEWNNSGIPQIAIEKYQNFCQDSGENIVTFITDVCNSNRIYENNMEKSIAILDFIAGINDISLISAEKAIKQINGELNKVSYLGIKCSPDCKVHGCEHRSNKNV
ncbi:MAG: hypothetical protein M0P71_01425 [Melioribacteraceae bacterium]|nr:hypothetical protein [Melioribacteraceae bacterium]